MSQGKERERSYLEELYGELAADQYKVDKYGHAGIYSISIILPSGQSILVYIGKSKDMLLRLSNHIKDTMFNKKSNKYKVIQEAKNRGYKIQFDVLYDCPYGDNDAFQDEDLGIHEGVYIRFYMPPLNYQIPKEGDWRHWHTQKSAKYITLDQIIADAR